ncbi:MAG TPA: FAD-binding oxidoreductase [Dongiaceae bacterium]|nr:FAD-binding oxidoreductase [Dongiaceae bacterium]
MSTAINPATKLADVIGANSVVSAPEELATHAMDGITPQVIACPTSAEQVQEIVRFAASERLAVQAFGSRSKCEMGMPVSRCDIAIDMTRLREVVHYDPGDLTLSVDAGIPLRELEELLSRLDQFLPLAVPCFESTTAGGAIASGIDSALRQQYGSARDFLIGAEFVDGTGQLCKSGGRVVKNVTGYDLHKLLIGSLSTLGVITRLNFRTFPLPPASGACLALFSDAAAALAFRASVDRKGLPLADMEILDPETAQILRAILQRTDSQVPGLLSPDAWSVYCSYEGHEAVAMRIAKELQQSAGDTKALSLNPLGVTSGEEVGGMLREAYEWLRWGSPATLLQRIVVPRLSSEILGALRESAAALGLRSSILVRACGVVYVSVFGEDEEQGTLASLTNTALNIGTLARARGGCSAILHAPLGVKTRVAAARVALPDESLQLRLKRAFDPGNLFAPGRIVGGV